MSMDLAEVGNERRVEVDSLEKKQKQKKSEHLTDAGIIRPEKHHE